MRALVFVGSLVFAIGAAGCGAAAMPAASAAGAPSRQLEQAEQELHAALGITSSDREAQGEAAKDAAPQPGFAQRPAPAPPPPVAPTEPAPQAAEAKPASRDVPADPCATACTALASMNRAADAVCRLTRADDPGCADARTRVVAATSQVRARCPRCAALP